MKKYLIYFFLLCVSILQFSCSSGSSIKFTKGHGKYSFESKDIKLVFDSLMNVKVYQKKGEKLLSIAKNANAPDYIVVNGTHVRNFVVDDSKIYVTGINDKFGEGKQLKLTGIVDGPSNSKIEKNLYIDIYEKFPESAIIKTEYKNLNSTPGLTLNKEIDDSFRMDASLVKKDYGKHSFWILQGGSYQARPDWIVPVTDDFSFENYQGPEWDKGVIGGGIPVLDVWCKETGFYIGSLRNKSTLISLPAYVDSTGYLNIGIEYKRDNLKFDSTYESIHHIIGVHSGDYFNGLRTYAKVMKDNGIIIVQPDTSSPIYGAEWCGWGFGPDFTPKQMIEVIPLLKKLHFKVATVDMGWFYHNGDNIPRDNIFPNGDESVKKFVKTFHDNGLLIDLWITPCIAGPELQKEHPYWLIKDKNENYITQDSYGSTIAYMDPSLKAVQDFIRKFVRKAVSDWGFDGFKMDQSLINAAPPCYAKQHHHSSPAESFEALPEIYKIIYDESLKLDKNAILEICPCGMFPSFYKMPYYNLPVSSDFITQWQIRERGKTIKALTGSHAAYFGDHVERHFKKSNFASMVGVGAIPGTMFVLRPEDNVEFIRVKYPCYLSPERKELFKKWLGIYNKYQLSKGEYLNLYDIAYDKPETHVIKKDPNLFYAFYADEWNGPVEFRGLNDNTNYIIKDYVNNKELGVIKGNGDLNVQFKEYLLVEAVPQ